MSLCLQCEHTDRMISITTKRHEHNNYGKKTYIFHVFGQRSP